MRFVVGGELRRGLPVPAGELSAVERAVIRMATDARRLNPAVPLADQAVDDLDISIADYFRQLDLPSQTYDFVVGVLAGWIQADPERTTVLHLSPGGPQLRRQPVQHVLRHLRRRFRQRRHRPGDRTRRPRSRRSARCDRSRESTHDQNACHAPRPRPRDIPTARACVVAVAGLDAGQHRLRTGAGC